MSEGGMDALNVILNFLQTCILAGISAFVALRKGDGDG
jgi:hypothetical protein